MKRRLWLQTRPRRTLPGTQGANINANNGGNTNFVTTPGGGTLAAIGTASNVFFTANTASNYGAATISAPTTINSLTLGVGAAAGSPIGLSGSTLTLNAAGTGGNATGNGITDSNTGVTDTISSNIALGASQSFTVTNAGNTLAISGVISDGGQRLQPDQSRGRDADAHQCGDLHWRDHHQRRNAATR